MGSLGPKSMRMGHGPKPKLHLSAALLALWWLGWELLLKLPSAGVLPAFRGNSGSCSWSAAGPSLLPPVGAGP